ncbi:condensation domain-containing protein, partial [Microbulbifer epialgicus]
HGREMLFEGLDVSETMGWFTSVYPIALTGNSSGDISQVIKRIKNQYRAVPNNGVGFGVLTEFLRDPELNSLMNRVPTKIVFNYLGQVDTTIHRHSVFKLASEFSGSSISERNRNRIPVTLSGLVSNGCLAFNLESSSENFDEDLVERIGREFRRSLINVIQEFLAFEQYEQLNIDRSNLLLNDEEVSQDDGVEI